jgi:hypothetical protein
MALMEQIIEKNTNRIMANHPELSRSEALIIAEHLYALAKIAIEGFKNSSNSPITIDNCSQNAKFSSKGVK